MLLSFDFSESLSLKSFEGWGCMQHASLVLVCLQLGLSHSHGRYDFDMHIYQYTSNGRDVSITLTAVPSIVPLKGKNESPLGRGARRSFDWLPCKHACYAT